MPAISANLVYCACRVFLLSMCQAVSAHEILVMLPRRHEREATIAEYELLVEDPRLRMPPCRYAHHPHGLVLPPEPKAFLLMLMKPSQVAETATTGVRLCKDERCATPPEAYYRSSRACGANIKFPRSYRPRLTAPSGLFLSAAPIRLPESRAEHAVGTMG